MYTYLNTLLVILFSCYIKLCTVGEIRIKCPHCNRVITLSKDEIKRIERPKEVEVISDIDASDPDSFVDHVYDKLRKKPRYSNRQ